MALGERLRKAREDKGWSQVYVSKLLGVTSQTLSNYERGERDPDTNILNKLAGLYEVPIDYLFERTDSKDFLVLNEPSGEYQTTQELIDAAKNLTPKQYIAVLNLVKSLSEADESDIEIKDDEINFKYTKKEEESKDMAYGVNLAELRERFPDKYIPHPSDDPITKIPYWYLRLKALRTERGLSLEEAAEQMGNLMTPEILQEFEEGREMPDPSDQVMLGMFYNTNWFFIIGRTNIRYGYAGETIIAKEAAEKGRPNEPLTYEQRKRMKEIYSKYGLLFDEEKE